MKKQKKYWEFKYNRAKNFNDVHWESDERHEHQEYVEALQISVNTFEEIKELKRKLELAAYALALVSKNFEHECLADAECEKCEFRTGNPCIWEYVDAVMKLIGE